MSPSRNIYTDLCENISEPESTIKQDQDELLLLDVSDSDIIDSDITVRAGEGSNGGAGKDAGNWDGRTAEDEIIILKRKTGPEELTPEACVNEAVQKVVQLQQ